MSDRDVWPLPAVEIERAEALGLVVRPESPATEEDPWADQPWAKPAAGAQDEDPECE